MMQSPHPSLAKHQKILAKYAEILPAREYKALESWLTTFYPFQLDWLLDFSRSAISNKSRQIGLSHTTAAVLVLWGVFHGETTTVISVGDRESKEVLEKVEAHRVVLESLGSSMARATRKSASEIRFASRGRALALPSSGGRSFTGNVFLDEFAYHMHPAKVWDAAAAVTQLGFKLRIASTPNGMGNLFHELWLQDDAFSRHEITIWDAIKAGYPIDVEHCRKVIAHGDPRLFAQFFECSFLDGALQYIPTECVQACTVQAPRPAQGYTYGGLDIGKEADRTELYIIQRGFNGKWQLRYNASCKRTSHEVLDRMVEAAFRRFNPRRFCVDATGIGAFPAEAMQKRFGRSRVEPVTFTLNSKEFLATVLYATIVGGQVEIPEADKGLRDDLCSIQRQITDSGNVRYDAPRTARGHADKAWALALALKAAGMVPNSAPNNANMV